LTAASKSLEELLIFAFRLLSGKQKNKTSPLRAQRLCGENDTKIAPFKRGVKPSFLVVVFDCTDSP
jgi:hypothetical protein